MDYNNRYLQVFLALTAYNRAMFYHEIRNEHLQPCMKLLKLD